MYVIWAFFRGSFVWKVRNFENLTFAVVLLNHNGLKRLQTFLPSVLKYTPLKNVYLIDNASTDASLAHARACLLPDHVLALAQNKGYAGGYNEGLRQIDGVSYYVLLNTDVEVSEGWWQRLLGYMEKILRFQSANPRF